MRALSLLSVLLITACTATPAPLPPPDPSATITAGPCKLPDEWTERLRSSRLAVTGTVVAASDDGHEVFVKTPDHRLLAVEADRTRVVLESDDGEPVGVDFDGRWLTFGIGHSPGNLGSWTAYAWDSRGTAEPMQIFDNRQARGGPLFQTVVHRGKTAWVVDDELHLYDLDARRDQVVARNVKANPAFFGEQLVWPDGGFHAVTLTGEPAAQVPAIELTTQHPQLASDGRTLLWAHGGVVEAWQVGWQKPATLVRNTNTRNAVQMPRVSGDLVSWVDDDVHVMDMRSTATRSGLLEVRGGVLTGRMDRVSAVAVKDLPPLPGC